jgi:hypothetical protein
MIHEDHHQRGDSFAPLGMTRETNGMTGGANGMTTEAGENTVHDTCNCHSEEAEDRRKNLNDRKRSI